MKKGYIFYYDFIKIVAAFMVCFYHLGMLDVGVVTDGYYIPNSNKIILNLCAMSVPLFFMVNGSLMLRRRYSVKEIILRALKIFFLYFFWVIVVGEIGVAFLQMDRVPLHRIWLGKRSPLAVHLWFLKTLGILTILLPVLKKIYDLKDKKYLYGIMICLFIFPFTYNYFALAMRWFKIECFNRLSVTGAATMYSVLYFFLGKMISDFSARQETDCKKYKLLAVFMLLLGWLLITIEVTLWSSIKGTVYDGVNSSFPTIGALFMAMGAFYLCSRIKVKQDRNFVKIVRILADNIMGIYIFHNICIPFVYWYVSGNNTILKSVIITLLIMLVTTGVTCMIKKIPILKEVVNI